LKEGSVEQRKEGRKGLIEDVTRPPALVEARKEGREGEKE
jgi:hypothetical protein